LFFDGTKNKFSWIIQTGDQMKKEVREHPSPYLSGYKLKISNEDESKFIALHVGIYWGLGVFIIKDGDIVNVMCDSKKMYELIRKTRNTSDELINDKIKFINHLVKLRNLVVNYHLIDSDKNPAVRLIR